MRSLSGSRPAAGLVFGDLVLFDERNTSITTFHRSIASNPSIRSPASIEVVSDSVEMWDTDVCFVHRLWSSGSRGAQQSLPSALRRDHLSTRVHIAGIDRAHLTGPPLPAAPFQCTRSRAPGARLPFAKALSVSPHSGADGLAHGWAVAQPLNFDRFHQPCLLPYALAATENGWLWGRDKRGLSSPFHVATTYPCGQPGLPLRLGASNWRYLPRRLDGTTAARYFALPSLRVPPRHQWVLAHRRFGTLAGPPPPPWPSN